MTTTYKDTATIKVLKVEAREDGWAMTFTIQGAGPDIKAIQRIIGHRDLSEAEAVEMAWKLLGDEFSRCLEDSKALVQ